MREDDGEEIDGERRERFRFSCPGWAWLFYRHVVELVRNVSGGPVPVWKAIEAINAEALAAAPRDADGEEIALESLAWFTPRPDLRGPRRTIFWPSDDDLEADAAILLGPGACAEVAEWLGLPEAEVAGLVPPDVTLLAGDLDGISPRELDRRMRKVVRELQRIDWRTGRLLRLLFGRFLHLKLGFLSQEDYLRERLGVAIRKARALLALESTSERVPELGEAYREGRISWVRASTFAPLAHAAETRVVRAWIERAERVPVRRLGDEVDWVLERRAADPAAGFEPPPLGAELTPVPIDVPVDAAVSVTEAAAGGAASGETDAGSRDGTADTLTPGVQMRERYMITFSGPASVVTTFRHLVVAWSEGGEPYWVGLVRLLAHVASGWLKEARRVSPIIRRDGYRCLVPCCSSRRALEVHHLVFRSAGGSDEDENLGAFCKSHHSILHSGKIRARGRAPRDLRWELGVGARGSEPLLRLRGEVYAPVLRAAEPATSSGPTGSLWPPQPAPPFPFSHTAERAR